MVSIIIPNFNHSLYLKERIESVLNQTYQDFEIIFLDDCSTDSSLKILEKYKDHPKVSHFKVNEKNSSSVFKQWVKGINLSKGEYIWIAESDDVADLKFLEKMISFVQNKKDVGLVFCKSKVINQRGEETGEVLEPSSNDPRFKINGEEDVSNYIIKKLSILNVSSVLFNAEAFKTVDFKKLSEFSNVGDMFAYSMIGLNHTNYFLDEFLNIHRKHGNNTTTINSINKKIINDRIELVQYLIPYFQTESGKKNILHFYFRQMLKSLDECMFKLNKVTLRSFYKLDYMEYRVYIKLKLLVVFYQICRGKIPFFVRKSYKDLMERFSFNE